MCSTVAHFIQQGFGFILCTDHFKKWRGGGIVKHYTDLKLIQDPFCLLSDKMFSNPFWIFFKFQSSRKKLCFSLQLVQNLIKKITALG